MFVAHVYAMQTNSINRIFDGNGEIKTNLIKSSLSLHFHHYDETTSTSTNIDYTILDKDGNIKKLYNSAMEMFASGKMVFNYSELGSTLKVELIRYDDNKNYFNLYISNGSQEIKEFVSEESIKEFFQKLSNCVYFITDRV